MIDDTIEALETKIAFLERANSELSDVVYRQQRDIVAMNERLTALAGRVDSIKVEGSYTAEEERPPHY